MPLEQYEEVGLVTKISSNISLRSKGMKLLSAQHHGRRSAYCPEAAREIKRLPLPPSLPIFLESHWAQHGVASPKYECTRITRYIVALAPRPPHFPAQMHITNKMSLQSLLPYHAFFQAKTW